MDNPQLYSRANVVQAAGAEKLLNYFGDLLVKEYGKDEITLIDIGSGCGTVLSNVMVGKSGLNFSKVVGVDVSKEMVEFSNKKYGNSIISFKWMNAEEEIPMEFKGQEFDMVSSIQCLHWMKDMKRALRNIHELLKPGGYFCCLFAQHYMMLDIWPALEQKYPRVLKDWRKNFTQLWFLENPDEVMRKYLEETGFKILGFIDAKDDSLDTVDEACTLRSLKASNPFKGFKTENEENAYFEDVMDLYRSTAEVAEGSFISPARLVYFVVEKV